MTTTPLFSPATCGVDMSPQFMLKMIDKIDNACMIKESTGDNQRMHKIYRLSKGKVPFLNGCNHMALEAFTAGASGWCTTAPCLVGEQPKKLFDAIQRGDKDTAQALFYQQYEFLEFIVTSSLAAAVKSGLSIQGKSFGEPRKPLLPLTEQAHNVLKSLLSEIS